jgi:hypothetical protein
VRQVARPSTRSLIERFALNRRIADGGTADRRPPYGTIKAHRWAADHGTTHGAIGTDWSTVDPLTPNWPVGTHWGARDCRPPNRRVDNRATAVGRERLIVGIVFVEVLRHDPASERHGPHRTDQHNASNEPSPQCRPCHIQPPNVFPPRLQGVLQRHAVGAASVRCCVRV